MSWSAALVRDDGQERREVGARSEMGEKGKKRDARSPIIGPFCITCSHRKHDSGASFPSLFSSGDEMKMQSPLSVVHVTLQERRGEEKGCSTRECFFSSSTADAVLQVRSDRNEIKHDRRTSHELPCLSSSILYRFPSHPSPSLAVISRMAVE